MALFRSALAPREKMAKANIKIVLIFMMPLYASGMKIKCRLKVI